MTENRVFYGDNENQFGDLRIPQGNGPHPVAIVIHGGFWRARVGLDNMNRVALDLTNRGIATWNIEYRRVGQEGGGWPGTFIDVAKAADYLYTLAESYPLDLNRVITIGHSAGGHLALWLAARHRLPATSVLKTTDSPLSVHGAVSLAGVGDLALMQEVHHIREDRQKLVDNPVFDLLCGDPDTVPERYAEASPIQLLPIGVKQLLVHGPLDIHVPIGISLSYRNAAELSGDDIKMIEIPTAEHFKLIDPDSEAWPVIVTEVTKLL
jgi:acetyl esterase/lipase